ITAIVLGDKTWRPFGPFLNPNGLAGYLALTIPVLIALTAGLRGLAAGVKPGHPSRVAWPVMAFICAIAVAGLLLTASKGALLGVVAALLVAGLSTRRARWLAIVAVVAVVAGGLFPTTRARLAAALSAQKATSLAFRLHTWLGTARMVAARPFLGWGPGTFSRAYPRFATVPFTQMAHCSWLQMAAEAGIPSALIFLAGLAWTASAAVSRAQRAEAASIGHHTRRAGAREPPTLVAGAGALLGSAATLAIIATLVHNLVDYTWYLPAVSLTTAAIAGTALGAARDRPPAVSRRSLFCAAALVTAAAIAGWQAWANVLADTAAAAASRGYVLSAEDAALLAARDGVFSPDAWVTLGKIREAAAGDPPEPELLLKAAEAYKQAVVWAPTDPAGWIGAARCLRLAGKLEEAVTYGASAAAVYPRGPAALLEYARVLEAIGRTQDALAVYRRITALADTEYARCPPLEGWADWHIAVAAAAVARSESRAEAKLAAWRAAARTLRDYLSWTIHYHQSMQIGGRLDTSLLQDLRGVAVEAAAALADSRQTEDRVLARQLRELCAKL
ncbi:MAG: O-antigen ligase family protein, partial [Armatimonadetes bacterium]|nr:O-antigen ligase family protein [Armatimonadota bacterium]